MEFPFNWRPFLSRLGSALLGLALSAAPGPVKVVYPAPESPRDTRHADLIELVETALRRTEPKYGPFTFGPSDLLMNESRALVELARGGSVNIAWSSTSEDKERDLLPVRIPMRKGIMGYRIALVDRRRREAFRSVRSLEDLQKLTMIQGRGWGDVALFEANGCKVSVGEYDGLFTMVTSGRGDLFFRGINEVFPELEAWGRDNPDLAVEEHLLVYYPWPFYCFFNRADHDLARRIETGLRIMMKDGSFDRIFQKYSGRWIRLAALGARRRIDLTNPVLPKATPLADASLWYVPPHLTAR